MWQVGDAAGLRMMTLHGMRYLGMGERFWSSVNSSAHQNIGHAFRTSPIEMQGAGLRMLRGPSNLRVHKACARVVGSRHAVLA